MPRTFNGYRRADGRIGVRNHVIVMNSVSEAAPLVRRLGAMVPEAVAVAHTHGDPVPDSDRQQTFRTLLGNATNPNVFAVLFVGVGGADDDAARLADAARAAGVHADRLLLADWTSLAEAFEWGATWLRDAVRKAADVSRVEATTKELIVGLECGGSDAWSGVTANPAVGAASDLLVEAGATVVLSETPEAIGAEHVIAANAASPEVAADFLRVVEAYEARMRQTGEEYRKGNPSPGNMRGGLTTLEEKSLGCIRKAGSTPLQEVVPYAVRPRRRGFVFMDTPGYDVASVAGMTAGGAQVVLFTTGRGSPTGSPIAPVIKVSTNSRLTRHMPEHIDVDAGAILDGTATVDDVGRQIYALLHHVADGAWTAAERQGHREFTVWRLAEDA